MNFDLNQAIQIKNREKGVAVKLLRMLKDSLEKTEALVDIQILKKTGKKNVTFPLKKIDFSKEKYESIQNKIFFRRLYNTIPEQQELNLQKKNKRFLEMQERIARTKDELKKRKEEAVFQERIYMRDILINQLQRKKNYAKEWTKICQDKHRNNQNIMQNRKRMENMFEKQKLIKEREKNSRKLLKSKELMVANQIQAFEDNQRERMLNEANTESGKIVFFNFVKNILKNVKKQPEVAEICQALKERENSQNLERYKKERDRRLRKMIVDLKKD